ncbi:uncharacterized protein ARMOST_08329 [Armillaria ostoyae]|uniref:DUF6535 domain-containing protein n=1 Tax=Armillaria ostoyae TaxID=47428 RepID=A0A284R8C9_ARMOS|nr:uncharacterized protein ARMOST_08329 [Armillaria ostoyae]
MRPFLFGPGANTERGKETNTVGIVFELLYAGERKRAGTGWTSRRGSIEFSQREEFWDDEETAKKGNDLYNYEGTMLNARVREDESRIHDANMVAESRDNVDVLLVFAGLFSAVVTTICHTSDIPELRSHRAVVNGSSVDAFSPSPQSPCIAFVPATRRLVYLPVLSLTTALVAILAEQWLHYYVVLPSGS